MAESNKRSKGKQKIEIKRLEDKITRRVTFSRRKKGLFNKASELSALTGAEIAVIVFSQGNRVFSFGNPSVDVIVDRFLSGQESTNLQSQPSLEYEKYLESISQLEEENKQYKILEGEQKAGNNGEGFWWEQSFDELCLEELEEASASLKKLRENVAAKLNNQIEEESSVFSNLDYDILTADKLNNPPIEEESSVFSNLDYDILNEDKLNNPPIEEESSVFSNIDILNDDMWDAWLDACMDPNMEATTSRVFDDLDGF